MAELIYGLKQIRIGDSAVDGGMGTVLTEVFGKTVLTTAVLSSTEPVTEDIFIEESDFAIANLTTTPGAFSLAFSSYEVSPLTMQFLFGGVITGTAPNETWSAPLTGFAGAEKSVQVETQGGILLNFPRVKFSSALSLGITKTAIGQLDVTGAVLQPTKPNTPPFSIVFGVEEEEG